MGASLLTRSTSQGTSSRASGYCNPPFCLGEIKNIHFNCPDATLRMRERHGVTEIVGPNRALTLFPQIYYEFCADTSNTHYGKGQLEAELTLGLWNVRLKDPPHIFDPVDVFNKHQLQLIDLALIGSNLFLDIILIVASFL